MEISLMLQRKANKTLSVLIGVVLLFWMQNVIAGATLSGMRIGQTDDKTRVVFDLKQAQKYQVSSLKNPSRVFIDFFDTKNYLSFKRKHLTDQRLLRIRVSSDKQKTRVVLDLNNKPDYKAFFLSKNANGKERLVIDLTDSSKKQSVAKNSTKKPVADQTNTVTTIKPAVIEKAKNRKQAPVKSETKVQVAKQTHKKVASPKIKPVNSKLVSSQKAKAGVKTDQIAKKSSSLAKAEKKPVKPLVKLAKAESKPLIQKIPKPLIEKDSPILTKPADLVVAIDAGHGGKDPGAIGPNKAYEKHVTLMISKELKKIIDKQPGMKAVLTRDRDVFLKLHERVKIAKQNHADIFISIHADAFRDKSIRGGSVYVLSERGASSTMARLLAKNENAALEDIHLASLDKDVAFALSDLSREANIKASKKLGKTVLREMRKTVRMHKKEVQSAGFAVLKSIDMPSLLIETAFISNPYEAKRLMTRSFQKKMASAIVDGLKQYAKEISPTNRWGDSLYVHYRVQRGDTLSGIAAAYQVSTRTLKKINKIRNANTLYVGKKLKIPVSNKVVAGI